MRRVKLILAALAISCQVYAQSNTGNIMQITPGKSTKADVEKLLGKPTEQISKDDMAKWRYRVAGQDISMEWYQDQLRNCHVSTREKDKQWSNDHNRLLEIGTDVASIVKELGLPDNMRIEPAIYLMEYKYQSNILRLSFNDGQLVRYEMNGLLSKK